MENVGKIIKLDSYELPKLSPGNRNKRYIINSGLVQ